MSWLAKMMRFSLVISSAGSLLSCGVKGDPLPPERPAELGRGRPTYKRATEGLQIKPLHSTPQEEEENDERE